VEKQIRRERFPYLTLHRYLFADSSAGYTFFGMFLVRAYRVQDRPEFVRDGFLTGMPAVQWSE
jgi:hypothetical protein